jgi:hypothetical protein
VGCSGSKLVVFKLICENSEAVFYRKGHKGNAKVSKYNWALSACIFLCALGVTPVSSNFENWDGGSWSEVYANSTHLQNFSTPTRYSGWPDQKNHAWRKKK